MTFAIPPPTAVLLPGTGSDEVFVKAVFAGPLRALGIELLAPPPPVGSTPASGYLAKLDELADKVASPILVGGISFGAHLAAEWALCNPARCAGLLAALPAWNGPAGKAPASLAAKLTADLVTRDGLGPALAASTEGVPRWLASELHRAWHRHGQGLAEQLRSGADHVAPTLAALRGLTVAAGIATCLDDPIHPSEIAYAWGAAMPNASVGETTLAAVGADRESLGRATVLGWLRARRRSVG